jgi:asparagine synthase (glutamine-hydrolysing)
MPNYGANDGTLVLPLSTCSYADYRPSLQAAHYLIHREFLFEKGSWDETAAWICGTEGQEHGSRAEVGLDANLDESTGDATSSISVTTNSDFGGSGYIKLEGRQSFGMLRAAEYRDRPSHADQLHLDLWWRGENVLCDAGSFLYSGQALWTNALSKTTVHNTVTLEDRDQMTRAGQFLWLDWAQARSIEYEVGNRAKAAEASHDGYARIGAMHRRSVLCVKDHDLWIVVDDLTGTYSGNIRLNWLFPDCPFSFDAQSVLLNLGYSGKTFQCAVATEHPQSSSLVRAGTVVDGTKHANGGCNFQIRGWRALYYGDKEPALSLAVEVRTRLPVRFVSVLAPAGIELREVASTAVRVHVRGHDIQVPIREDGAGRIFVHVEEVRSEC